ncbi:MAG: hypothetical protein OEW06_06475 [Gemmatimonadota bacterium]|nr:hypothetical protein [Gemmatimonadota bacterium]
MPQNKLIPINDLVQLITDAGVTHQRGIYETSLSKLTIQGGDPLADLSTAYEIAGSLGIPDERMDEVIANRYPSVESQLAALENHGAVATTKAVAKTYQLEIENALRSALPGSDFRTTREHLTRKFDQPHLKVKWYRDYSVGVSVITEREVTTPVTRTWHNLWGLRGPLEHVEVARDSTLLARIDVGNEYVPTAGLYGGPRRPEHPAWHRTDRLYFHITVSSGVFIKLCSPTLEALRARFERHNGIAGHEVAYDYVVE